MREEIERNRPGDPVRRPQRQRPEAGQDGPLLTPAALMRRPQMWGFVATTASVEFCRGALFLSLLPAYLTQSRHLSVAALGLVISGQYLTDTLCKVPAGWLVDRLGPWRVLLPFLGLATAAVYLMPRAQQLTPFLLLAIAFGLGTSANWPAVLAGSVHIAGMRSRASATSITFLAWLAGGGIGPVLINFLVGRSFHTAFDVLAAVALIGPTAAAIGLSGLLRSPADPPWRQHEEEDIATTMRETWDNLRQSAWIIPGMFVQMLALGIVVPVLVPFARTQLHLSQPQYGWLLLAGGSVTVLCLIPFSRLVDRIGSKRPLIAGFVLAALSVLLLGWAGAAMDLLWRVALLGLSYALVLPAWNGLTVGQIDAQRRGLLLGVFMTIEGMGIAIGPAIGGALYTWAFRAPFVVAAGILLAVAAFYLTVPDVRFGTRRPSDAHR